MGYVLEMSKKILASRDSSPEEFNTVVSEAKAYIWLQLKLAFLVGFGIAGLVLFFKLLGG